MSKEKEDDEDWKRFWEAIWIKKRRKRKKSREIKFGWEPRLNLGSRDLGEENEV